MHRLTSFLEKYRPQADPGVLRYLEEACVVLKYSRGAVIKTPNDPLPYFCIVLEGLVGGYESNNGSDPLLRELILPMDYFSGTAHPFSQRNRMMEYRTLTPAAFARFPIHHIRRGQQLYPDMAELFHIMKQRKIDQLRKQIAIYQQKDLASRYALYATLMPDWTHLLPRDVQCQFLQMSKTHFHRAKGHFLRNTQKNS
jgi:CRP-like cAMP-binding protein